MFNRNNHNVSDTILDVNELIDEIPNCTWRDKLIEERDDFAEKVGHCKCGSPLETIDQWKESRGEMLGREVYEDMYKLGCTKCGYIKQ